MTTLSLSQVDETENLELSSNYRFGAPLSVFLTDFLLTPYRSLWVLFDLFTVFWLFTFCLWLSPHEVWGTWNYQNLSPALVFALSFTSFALGMGYYERPRRFTKSNIFGVSLAATIVALLVSLAIVYFTYYEVIGRLSLVYGSLGAYFGITTIRFTLSQFLRKNPYRFTVLGSSNCVDEIINFCKKNRRETRFYTYLDWKQELFPSDAPMDVQTLRKAKVPNLVLAKSALDDPEMIEFALQALQKGCRVMDELTFYIQFFEKVPINDISKNWVLHEGIDTRPIFFSIGKRLFDLTSSLIAMILLSPLFLLLSIIIKLSSPGPVFFFQIRMGRFCKPFRIIKFRTMTFNPGQKEIISTALNDSRVTKIGRLIRPLHIDELPQLWNVFWGNMSIVGPRPEAFDFAQKMRKVPLYDLRHLLRPGITGHAQITQGYTQGVVEEMTEKLEYDLYYVSKSSLVLDLRIILRTVFCLAKRAR